MGSARHCSHCQTSHEGPVGRKCGLAQQQQGDTDEIITMETSSQASTSSLSATTINEDQARLAVNQVQTPCFNSSSNTSTGASVDSQALILAELQKISQRFGQLEEQTSKDRQVLSGLVKQVNAQASNTVVNNEKASVNQEATNRSVNFTSPKPKTLSAVSLVNKDSVATMQGGYHPGIALTDQSEGFGHSVVRSKSLGCQYHISHLFSH